MSETSKRHRFRFSLTTMLIVMVLIAVLLCAISFLFMRRGVLVVVHNSGARPMFDVEVELGGGAIELGQINGGDSARGRVVPRVNQATEVGQAGAMLPDELRCFCQQPRI